MKRLKILMLFSAALLFSSADAFAREPQAGNDTQVPSSSAPVAPLPPQDNGSHQAPAPAGRALSIYGPQDQDSGQAPADDTTLTGGELVGLGSLIGTRTLFNVAFNFGEFVETGISQSTVDSVTSIGGSFGIDERWDRYRLDAFYSGAQTFYAPNSSSSTAYHSAALSQEIKWRRVVLHLSDSLNVSPQSNFGGLYTGSSGLAGQINVINGYNPVIASGETILTGQATHIDNVTLTGIDLLVSRRATVTFTGSYDVLHYFTAGYINFHQENFGTGYNYSISPKNTIGVSYYFGRTGYSGVSGGSTQNQTAQLSYGRRITGRLTFQISGGPQLVEPVVRSSSNSRYWTWTLTSSLSYRLSRATGASFTYYHIASNGSGVFVGSEADTFTGGINHQFTRFWTGSLNGGYSRNTSLVPSNTASNEYDNGYAGLSISRQIGREINVSGNVAYQRQTNAGGGVCPVLSCGYSSKSSTFVAGLNVGWSPVAIGKK